jgi:hypothetical protein
MTIHVVFGFTGEHDDYQEWMVKAFTILKRARAHAKWAQYYADKYEKSLNGVFHVGCKGFTNPYDPVMQRDYNGTDYMVREVELDGIADAGK